MKPNITRNDRIVRFVFGTISLAAGAFDFFPDGLLNTISIGLGIVLWGTALFSFCPVYRFFGIKSLKSNKMVY